ncbi:MAG: aminomethyltransferase family protein [Desulfococcaceae bacterium]|jgi:aminomethyltransferase|nr:aminomethyltransferase family protein [Desulfococcaceae bacterium]
MVKKAKKTLLYDWHTARGAKMGVFGGYAMPLWYASARGEHLAVLTNAGLFDTSHMAAVSVQGADAFDLLQLCFTGDLRACIGRKQKALCPGRCVYGAFLNEKGEVTDDAIVFMIAEGDYLVAVNAGMGQRIAAHLMIHQGRRDMQITDLTGRLGKADIQGPDAARILKKILKHPEKVFDAMPYFSFKGHFEDKSPSADAVRLTDGSPVLLSRTGYTGEFGFELFCASEHLLRIWEMLMEAGEEFGITACGLAARDSLRAGAVLPLSHQDIGHWPFIRHPWPFALPRNAEGRGFRKNFIGADALLKAGNAPYTYPFAGNDPRKVSLPAAVADENGEEIGTVLTCATDMAIGRQGGRIYSIASPDKPEGFTPGGLGCGFVKVNKEMKTGDKVELRDGRRKITVQIVKDIRPDRTARKLLKDML